MEVRITDEDRVRTLRDDVRSGLSAWPKALPPKWFYDDRGSKLFEEITALREYYPFRDEHEILTAHADELADVTAARTLVELGSGSSEKTRLLLDALDGEGTLTDFVPLDVSESALRESALAIASAYPNIRVSGVVGDFVQHLTEVPGTGPRLVVFLGGTIGNMLPEQRAGFLTSIRELLRPGEWLLLGTGLAVDESEMVAAYDDALGVTAEFNRNVLRVLNTELGADFDPDAFDHVARWNAEEERIEMWLRARREMRVHLPGVEMTVRLADGEEIHTEISAKFRTEAVRAELCSAGFATERLWTSAAGRFAVTLARAQ